MKKLIEPLLIVVFLGAVVGVVYWVGWIEPWADYGPNSYAQVNRFNKNGGDEIRSAWIFTHQRKDRVTTYSVKLQAWTELSGDVELRLYSSPVNIDDDSVWDRKAEKTFPLGVSHSEEPFISEPVIVSSLGMTHFMIVVDGRNTDRKGQTGLSGEIREFPDPERYQLKEVGGPENQLTIDWSKDLPGPGLPPR